jgi:urease accessory protein
MNMRESAPKRQAGKTLTITDLVKLQTWFSPSFPIGAFSYSHGLEWAIDAGSVHDPRSLTQWIEGVLRHGAGRSDLILLGAMWRAVDAADWTLAREIAALAIALQPTEERRLESVGQGNAFLCAAAAAWPHRTLQAFRASFPADTAYPVAVAVVAAAHGLPLDAVAVACLHAFAANLVSAGVRLVPLGQSDGLRSLARLEPAIVQIARLARHATLDDVGSASVLADIASMRHETQYTRLFRS